MATERQNKIKMEIIKHAETMAKSLDKGKDLEVRKNQNGISVSENTKKVIVR